MGKNWRKYEVGRYRLGTLFDDKIGKYEAVVVWRDERTNLRHRERLGVYSETEGRAALDAWVSGLKALKGRGSVTVKMIWDEYVADRISDDKLVAVFGHNWKALGPRFGNMLITDITNDVCRDYAKERLAKGRTTKRKRPDGTIEEVWRPINVGTVWTELLRLRSCINWAWDHNRLKSLGLDSKPKVWVPQKPASNQKPLTVDQFILLVEACRATPHLRLFVILAITTAGRTEAIVQLRWERVHFDTGIIDLREPEGKVDPLSKRARKGRAEVLMTAEARAALWEAKEGALTDHVIEWDCQPVRKIRKAFQAAVERAGLAGLGITPHTLRHTALTWLEEDGIPVELISKLAAHSGPDITRQIYLHAKAEILRPTADALERRLHGLLPAPTMELKVEKPQPLTAN
jgi:integrase